MFIRTSFITRVSSVSLIPTGPYDNALFLINKDIDSVVVKFPETWCCSLNVALVSLPTNGHLHNLASLQQSRPIVKTTHIVN